MSRRPVGDRREAGAALLLVLVFAMMALILLTALMSLIRSELTPAAFHGRSATSMRAAQSGVDAATAAIRSAVLPGGVGDLTRLPCNGPAAPVVGFNRGDGRVSTYRAAIRYYTVDPTPQSETWRRTNALACTPGAGPGAVPVYALITVSGVAPEVGRATGNLGRRGVESVYRLRFTDSAQFGGTIQVGKLVKKTAYCWSSPSTPPAAGSVPLSTPCVAGDPLQQFSYRRDFSIVLTATETSPGTGGMCLQATWSGKKAALSFQACDGSGRQKWGRQKDGFEALSADGRSLSGQCVKPVNGKAGGNPLTMAKCGGASQVIAQSQVGTGGAGRERGQLVNYGEFGTCMDLKGPGGVKYAVGYACEQNPTAPVSWDQLVGYDAATGRLSVNKKGKLLCLTDSGTAGGYAVPAKCAASNPYQSWTLNGATGYRTTSYTLVARVTGRCAGLGPGGTKGKTEVWSSVQMQVCNGSYVQKWGADALSVGGIVLGYRDRGEGTSLP